MSFDGLSNICWTPDIPSLGKDHGVRLRETEYIDGGYKARKPDGINTSELIWQLTFANRPDDILNDMTDFLRMVKGRAFWFLDPTNNSLYTVICDEWKVDWTLRRPGGQQRYGTLTATFERVYGANTVPLPMPVLTITPSGQPFMGEFSITVTTGDDPYLSGVVVYLVPAGETLDKSVHSRWEFPIEPNSSTIVKVGNNGGAVNLLPNANMGVITTLGQPLLGTGWSAQGRGRHGGNRVMTSDDGYRWTMQRTPFCATGAKEKLWFAMCYAQELSRFVVVGQPTGSDTDGQLVMTSPDALVWTFRTIGNFSWRGVCWAPSIPRFVAVGGTGSCATSPDGVTWTSATPAGLSGMTLQHVCWSPTINLFVATASAGTNRIATSPDGITWTARTSPGGAYYEVIWVVALGLFVVGGAGVTAWSPDGTNWTAGSAIAHTEQAICYDSGHGKVIMMGTGSAPRSANSPDGKVWTDRPCSAIAYQGVAYSPDFNNAVGVAVSGGQRVVVSSNGGDTWGGPEILPNIQVWSDITFAPDKKIFATVARVGTTPGEALSWPVTIASGTRYRFGTAVEDYIQGTLSASYGGALVENDAFTKILLHMDGADGSTTFTDVAAGGAAHTWTRAGDAKISTAQSVFGGASALLDGTGDFITTPDHEDFALGSSDWTVDLRFRLAGGDGAIQYLFAQADSTATVATSSIYVRRTTTGFFQAYASDGTSQNYIITTKPYTTTSNTGWHHLALVRSGSLLMMFIDGVLEASGPISGSIPNSPNVFCVGTLNSLTGYSFNGNIDEFRLSVGIARWTANFTPPAVPYYSGSGVVTLGTRTSDGWILSDAIAPAAATSVDLVAANPEDIFATDNAALYVPGPESLPQDIYDVYVFPLDRRGNEGTIPKVLRNIAVI
jgi:phage-related protein